MKRLLVLAALGSIACAIEYRVPVDDADTEADDDTGATTENGELECEHICDDAREVCVAGACACREGFVDCDGRCVDLETDPAHCGECNRDCGGVPCGGGECRPEGCGAFADQCGNSCTDVSLDPLHCSECGRTCDGDEICVDGDCEDID